MGLFYTQTNGFSTLGNLLLKKLKIAVSARDETVEDFQEVTASFQATSVVQWLTMVDNWEMDGSNPNPFVAVAESELSLCLQYYALLLTK